MNIYCDNWIIDYMSMVEKCLSPFDMIIGNIVFECYTDAIENK